MNADAAPERLRDAERTRAELLAVAAEVFAEQGYSGARVDDIAERTRTTKRMIYYYFGGKERLYLRGAGGRLPRHPEGRAGASTPPTCRRSTPYAGSPS